MPMADDIDYARYDRIRPLRWTGNALELLDQRKLPFATEYVTCTTSDEVAAAIHSLVVRGAPAIGIAAAWGVVLAERAVEAADVDEAAARYCEDKVNEAVGKGAKVLVGNIRKGALYSPTVVDKVTQDMPLVLHEIDEIDSRVNSWLNLMGKESGSRRWTDANTDTMTYDLLRRRFYAGIRHKF